MTSFDDFAFNQGLWLSLGLTVAIGAQNAFVLRQGLRREHVPAIVLFCTTMDALLVAAGVTGMGQVLAQRPAWAQALALAGAAFLLGYGLRALWRACAPSGALVGAAPGSGAGQSRQAVLVQAAAFTLLNPHVYVDTLLLVGSVGARHEGAARAAFVAGAGVASLLWFTALGFGARWLAPLFARPRAWQWLDGAVGLSMLALGMGLLRQALP
ncbi:LysE family transporter [Xenophilus arseniciresistens]|uniref:LysE family transporter n=1 Tax=Xenophilus arseniciresistens TaxID=1283306 RepID=A0AAE3SYJ7_9BURK|nr:LysE family transporter [Xenophilus arseniciresistens]MDA7415565.1 LysE family transporter [Xenophilus arseniciresistens]